MPLPGPQVKVTEGRGCQWTAQRSHHPGVAGAAGHVNAVAVVDPAAHAYPAVQLPVHVDTASPVVDPNRPGSQGPVQAAEGRPVVAP